MHCEILMHLITELGQISVQVVVLADLLNLLDGLRQATTILVEKFVTRSRRN